MLVDIAVAVGVCVLLWSVVRVGSGTLAPLPVETAVELDPAALPGYAGRSLLRMFAALALSLLFSLVVGGLAAKSRRAEKIIIPVLDILQSVPVLAYLSVTVTAFIALFPGSTLGLEAASVFAIFTSQAWNLTFAFYQSLVTQSAELDEAARALRLTRWQRFRELDVPGSMIPLVWNGTMSFGGGWFFLVQSEAISVLNQKFALPGIGSYVAAASAAERTDLLLLAIGAMVIMVVAVNVLFWRPLTAWAERFRLEQSEAAHAPRSMVLDLLRRSRLPGLAGRALRPMGEGIDRAARVFGRTGARRALASRERSTLLTVLTVVGLWLIADYVSATTGWPEVLHTISLGLITLSRVLVVVLASALVWVPIGVWIGMNPRVSRLAQPVVQVLASFPANFLFPFAAALFLVWHVGLGWGGILLMSLGAQWYVLFNVIAGASAIPSDLREAATNLRLKRWQRWRFLVLPAIFPAFVTGALTAAGGAWNASIVAEVITYGSARMEAPGLGAYITNATELGDMPRVFVGVVVMSAFVVGVNRLFWRRLHRLSEHYALQ
ncbi:ABC transporter permease subunit [Allokutzneria sp. A3M-2-11 16]|uniref:ABC transporter permease n=1 Tax=Allokutzneria sp. A3M-2-11 16 TaxID=2962043 RepID=UPI0020B72F85|nr:ABC transporter permease subunit [Allokutzneria sp. A3M-2-11 16]MCP3798579.1 ABC transporter permease subunit [Allokutzneria sp. A3M-2-11 16]